MCPAENATRRFLTGRGPQIVEAGISTLILAVVVQKLKFLNNSNVWFKYSIPGPGNRNPHRAVIGPR
jgi:hypothetical protein